MLPPEFLGLRLPPPVICPHRNPILGVLRPRLFTLTPLILALAVVFYSSSHLALVIVFWVASQINGEVKQNGCTSDMMFKIPALIEHVSSIMTLEVSSSFLASFRPFDVNPV